MVIRKFTWKPYLMLTWPDAMLIKIFGMKYGLRRPKRFNEKKTQISHFILQRNVCHCKSNKAWQQDKMYMYGIASVSLYEIKLP